MFIFATVLIIVGTAGASSVNAGTFPVSAPVTPLMVTVNNPGIVTVGERYAAPVKAVATTGTPISGCFRLTAQWLPAGLSVKPAVVCTTGATAISASITGTVPKTTRALAHQVVVDLYAVTSAHARIPRGAAPVGSTNVTLLMGLPNEAVPTPVTLYAGDELDLVDCVVVNNCWVVGTSSNPSPTNTTTTLIGHPPRFDTEIDPLTHKKIQVYEGGGFIAKLVSTKPLVLDVVRTGISSTINGLGCFNVTTCVAVGTRSTSKSSEQQAFGILMGGGGTSWSSASPVLPSTIANIKAISCPSSVACVAVGSVQYADGHDAAFSVGLMPRKDAALFESPTILTNLASELGAVSCPDALTCVAAGAAWKPFAPTGDLRIVVTHDSGRSWASDQLVTRNPGDPASRPAALQPYFDLEQDEITFEDTDSMGCAPTSGTLSCATAWGSWPAIADTNDGHHWLPGTLSQAPDDLTGVEADAVSCPKIGHCFVVTNPFPICGPDKVCNYVGILESIPTSISALNTGPAGFGQPGWEWGVVGFGPPSTTSPRLLDISCASETTCVAVGNWQPTEGTTWSPQFPLAMGPQSATSPYFVPPDNPLIDFLTSPSTWGMALAVVGAFTGLDEVAGAIGGIWSMAAGAGGIAIGVPTCFQGDWQGCAATVIGTGGLFSYEIGFVSSVLGITDPGSPTPGPPLPSWLQNAMDDDWDNEADQEVVPADE